MWVYENLEMCIGGVFAAGIAEHYLRRWRHRHRYRVLRAAYERAVRQAQATDCDPAAVVRCTELERDLMRAWWLPWSFGLGARIRKMLKLCAVLTLLAFVLKGPIERGEAQKSAAQYRASSSKKPHGASPAVARSGE
jgi:hypothetical protein